MLIILSPAKTLDFESPAPTKTHSSPRLLNRSEELVKVLAAKSPEEIADLMHLSDSLAELNFERFQEWTPDSTPETGRGAALAFKGDVYVGMNIGEFSTRDFTQAQKRLRILSGLYGLLRPLDLIQPYRLEMGSKLANPYGKNLYEFWDGQITNLLNEDLAAAKSRVLVNLASTEYFSAVQPEHLDARIVSPVFLDEKNGNYKIISFFAKRARGVMASWLIRDRVTTIKGIADFEGMGYRFDPERSTAANPTFIRPEAA